MAESGTMRAPARELSQAADVLMWRGESALPTLWRDDYTDHLAARLDALCASDEDGVIPEALALMPKPARGPFLRAHSVAAELLKPASARIDAGWIAKALMAELAHVGVVGQLEETLWTANGDRSFGPGAAQAGRGSLDALPGAQIRLDIASPFDFGFSKVSNLTHLSEPEIQVVAGKIFAAADYMRVATPSTLAFCDDCVSVVAVRKAVEAKGNFSSGTFARHAGMMLLGFGDPANVDVAQLADALTHEAIHSFMFMFEEAHGKFVGPEIFGEVVRSPWTGNTLRLDAYVHACTVWYGLYWLWTQAQATEAAPAERREALRSKALSGFADRPVTQGLAPVLDRLSPPIAVLLCEMEDRMAHL